MTYFLPLAATILIPLLLIKEPSTENGIPDTVKASLRLTLERLGEAVEKLPFKGDATLENIIKNTVYLGLPDRIELLGKPKSKNKNQPVGGNHDRSL